MGHSRLLREAQAMAKISHANVLQVYEVGTHAGQVFLALEFVEGSTLADWLLAAPRDWRAVLEIFLQAGRGLQAAHEAGVVHRDFKPENVLVDRSGRARVMDFGLARATGTMQPVQKDIPVTATHSSLEVNLTVTGAVMGTPLYMAPEQHLGGSTDARTDEFAFCVALYEALYRQRPFDGDDLRSLASNVLRGLVREPPRDHKVPAWLRRAVLRGLSAAPEDRYPGLLPLLAELARDHDAPRRRGLLAAAALVLVLAVGWGFVAAAGAAGQRCRGGAVQLAGTWDSARADQLSAAFAATARPYAVATGQRVRVLLDARAAAWAGLHVAACEAHARGEASAELYDLELACLERRRSETHELVDLLARADAEVVDRAVGAVMALPPVTVCADRAALLARVKPPEDPALAAEVARLRVDLDRARALQDAGKLKEGIALATSIADAADASGHRPAIAEARLRLGELHSRASEFAAAEPALWAALWAAEASRHDEVAAAAWTELVRLAGKQGKLAEGQRWAERAGAALARIGAPPIAEARLENELGNLAYQAEDHVEAEHHYRRALELRRAALGPDHIDVAASLANLGNALLGLDRNAEALAIAREALALREASLGRDHVDVAASLNNIAVIDKNAGRYGDAIAALTRARDIWTRALGPDNPNVANADVNLASTYYQRGELGRAADIAERAIALSERLLSLDHPMTLKAYSNAGAIAVARGDLERGEVLLRTVYEVRLRVLGPDHPDVASAFANLASLADERGRLDEAAEMLTRAIAIVERRSGPDHSDLVASLSNLAHVELLRGALERAELLARRAIAIADSTFGADAHQALPARVVLAGVAALRREPGVLVELDRIDRIAEKTPLEAATLTVAHFARAMALVDSGGDRGEAARLARESLAYHASRGATLPAKQVTTWLARHRL
ncbi:serine/threonine-protein kinase [Nannocystis sp.]|uniref:serine/threonine-protein kinase n=1 Tax=Nannocystis sp. TaxID=1962667 RepID=UPI002600B5AC|nr:serine/threonine-protein kinase [Nannocystis sp.]MBK7824773.1 serine/threonine protein kinase [Nannocystis sp.]